VIKWLDRYQELGVEGLFDFPRSGRNKKLSEKDELLLISRIQNGAREGDEVSVFKAWNIRDLIENEFGVKYAKSSIYNLLKRLNFTRIKPRPKHEKNDKALMDQWKQKTLPEKYASVKREHPNQSIEIWFQDEMRYGEKTRIVSQWRLSGTSFSQTKQFGYRNSYLYGAVNPDNGEHVGLVFSECSTEVMNIHLSLISQGIAANHHAILIMDQAGWHASSKDLKIPENISILNLPPYSPELNPVERLWLWLKNNFLSNYTIKKNEDLLELGSKVWKKLNNSVVKSICHEEYLSFTNFS